jgi:hypothetical protein
MPRTILWVAFAATACTAAPPPSQPAATRIEPMEEEPLGDGDVAPPSASRTPPPGPEDERAAGLKKRFDEDPPGDSAARKFEDDYRKVFLQPEAKGASLESVECHRVVCRAVVLLDDKHVHNRLFINAMRESGMSRYAASLASREETADGKLKATVYVFQSRD